MTMSFIQINRQQSVAWFHHGLSLTEVLNTITCPEHIHHPADSGGYRGGTGGALPGLVRRQGQGGPDFTLSIPTQVVKLRTICSAMIAS